MAGYVLMDVEITNQDAYMQLLNRAREVVEAHGGKHLVRGGAAEVLQGDRAPGRLVVLEFDSVEQARAWWSSPAHAEMRSLFGQCANTSSMLVEGV